MGISFLVTAFFCLLISFVLSEFFLKIKYSRIIGQILAGMVLSIPVFSFLFTNKNIMTLNFVSDLGIIFLMLLTGLCLDLKKLRNAEKDALIVGALCVFFPFIFGLMTMRFFGYSWVESLIVGACISITAEGTTMEVLYDLRTLNTKLGSVILSTGIFDDIFEFLFLFSLLIFTGDTLSLDAGLTRILAFTIIIFILFKFLPLFLKVVNKDHLEFTSFTMVVIIGLFIAIIASNFHLGLVLGALIGGVLISHSDNKKNIRKHIKHFELLTFSIFVPFFFIRIGLTFDFLSIMNNLLLSLVILVVAIAGTLIGAFVAMPFTDLTLRQANLLGWALNSRGLMELVIASLALSNGLIGAEVFSALIAMALITTIMFPFAVKFFAKDRKIWYE